MSITYKSFVSMIYESGSKIEKSITESDKIENDPSLITIHDSARAKTFFLSLRPAPPGRFASLPKSQVSTRGLAHLTAHLAPPSRLPPSQFTSPLAPCLPGHRIVFEIFKTHQFLGFRHSGGGNPKFLPPRRLRLPPAAPQISKSVSAPNRTPPRLLKSRRDARGGGGTL
jgi:hypothetical protein